jgi:hypothetical protein
MTFTTETQRTQRLHGENYSTTLCELCVLCVSVVNRHAGYTLLFGKNLSEKLYRARVAGFAEPVNRHLTHF